VLQGERRWEPLALVYLFQGLGRLICGLVMILLWQTEFSAMLGVAVGAWLPVLVGYIALRAPRTAPPDRGHPGLDLIKEVGHSSQALLAFFALSNADILLARALLTNGEAGLYAAGLIMSKAVLFLPQFVVVIAFPSMSTQGASRRTLVLALGTVTAIGGCAVLGTLLLPDLATIFVGGDDYSGISGNLWKFAILGTLLAMIQLLVYSALARRQGRALLMIWTTLGLLLLGVTQVDSVSGMIHLVLVLDGLLFLALFVTALTTRPEPLGPVDEVDELEHTLLHHES
jgi:O-antigen/teichoic acid export membrane protein